MRRAAKLVATLLTRRPAATNCGQVAHGLDYGPRRNVTGLRVLPIRLRRTVSGTSNIGGMAASHQDARWAVSQRRKIAVHILSTTGREGMIPVGLQYHVSFSLQTQKFHSPGRLARRLLDR
jgi:hypothetical protein